MHYQSKVYAFKKLFTPLTTSKALYIIVIIGIIIFCNGLVNGFVWDDLSQIIQNPAVQSLQNLPTFFSGGTFYIGPGYEQVGIYYKPLLSTAFAFLYTFFGPNNFVFHLFQLMLYIANACIIFLLFKKFFKIPLAFLLALVFLIHPVNSEVALYISDSQDVMFLFFGISALIILEKFHSKKAILLISFLLFLSILSKETGVLLIFMSLVYAFMFKRGSLYKLLGFLIPFLCLYAYLLLSAHSLATPFGHTKLIDRFISMPAIFLFYLKIFIFPYSLAVSYQWLYTQIDFLHFYLPLLIDLLVLLIIYKIGFLLYKKDPHKIFKAYLFFCIWFVAGVLFHLQIIPLDQTVSDRYFYFPIIGLLGMTGVAFDAFNLRINKKWAMSITIIILLLLGLRTFVRTFDFRSDLILSSHDIKYSKEATALEDNMSNDYYHMGNYKEAIIHAESSIKQQPNDLIAYNLIGASYFSLHDYKDAKIAYLKSIQLGDYYVVYDNLATLSLQYGNLKEDINFIKNKSLKKFPQDGRLWLILGILNYREGNKQEAINNLETAYEYNKSAEVNYVYTQIMKNKQIKINN